MKFVGLMQGALSGFYFGQGMNGWGVVFLAIAVLMLLSWYGMQEFDTDQSV